MAIFPEQRGHNYQRHNREQHQHTDLPLRWRFGEQAEGGATVLHVREPEEVRNYLDAVVQRNFFGNHPFRNPIEEHDAHGNQEVELAHGVTVNHWVPGRFLCTLDYLDEASAPSCFRTALQRSQTMG